MSRETPWERAARIERERQQAGNNLPQGWGLLAFVLVIVLAVALFVAWDIHRKDHRDYCAWHPAATRCLP